MPTQDSIVLSVPLRSTTIRKTLFALLLSLLICLYWKFCGTASPEPNEIGGGSSGFVTGTFQQAHPFSNCCVPGSLMLMGVGC